MRNWLPYTLVLTLLLTQCAKQTAPTGGPTDETPPKLESSNPKHEQTNVKSSKIELAFDEHIQLNKPREEIIITPSVGKDFEITFNKNKVSIDLKTELQQNTTYNVNFREAIQDLTEKNPATVKLAFSTGDYIDSLQITGKVFDALTEKRNTNYTVALVEVSDTFSIFKHPASWIALTDKQGRFSLENLKPGNYLLYAFDDRSKNLIVDSKSEKYGFIAEPISLKQNIDSLNIRTFKLDINKLKLITARSTFAYFNLRFSKSLIDYTVTTTDTTQKAYSTLESDLSTIKLYNTFPGLDSVQIRVRAIDSLNTSVDTLVYIKFPKKDATKDKLSSKNEPATLQENNYQFTSTFTFSKPITAVNTDSLYIEIDSLNKLHFAKDELTWDIRSTTLKLTKKIPVSLLFPKDTAENVEEASKKVKKEPALKAQKGTFISLENDTAQSMSTQIKLLSLEVTSIIETKVESNQATVIQITNKNGELIQQRVNEKTSTFENLNPETYSIRIIIDFNKNGKWDPGNFSSRTEPEPIIYYRNSKGSRDVPLKANWHVGPLLIKY